MRIVLLLMLLLQAFLLAAQPADRWINEKKVREVISMLASDEMQGRRPLTPSIDRAASYLAEEFRKAGLTPMPGAGNFLQRFEAFSASVSSLKININGLPVQAADIIAFPARDKILWDDDGAETVRLDGKGNIMQSTLNLLQSGKNLLILADSSMRRSLSRLRNARMQRLSGGSVFIIFFSGDVCHYKVEAEANISRSAFANVVGMIPGKGRPKESVIFSAHYDHLGIGKPKGQDSVYNGANDDASGTTAVVMLGRYFSHLPRPERTLIFAAFTAEESGGYGSRYFASQLQPERVAAMFNIEMIGTESKWGKNSAFITGFEKSDFGSILQQALQGSEFQFYPDPYPSQNLFYRSDNATLAALGVPAHTISTSKMDSEKYYHTVDDEVETLDLANMTRIIRAIAVSSKGIVNAGKTPTRITN